MSYILSCPWGLRVETLSVPLSHRCIKLSNDCYILVMRELINNHGHLPMWVPGRPGGTWAPGRAGAWRCGPAPAAPWGGADRTPPGRVGWAAPSGRGCVAVTDLRDHCQSSAMRYKIATHLYILLLLHTSAIATVWWHFYWFTRDPLQF